MNNAFEWYFKVMITIISEWVCFWVKQYTCQECWEFLVGQSFPPLFYQPLSFELTSFPGISCSQFPSASLPADYLLTYSIFASLVH